MSLVNYTCGEVLKPFVKGYKIIDSQHGQLNRILPTTSCHLAFRLRGKISYEFDEKRLVLPSSTLSGFGKSARLIRYEPETTALIIQFTETGPSAFFGNSIHSLNGQSISLDNFFPKSEIQVVEDMLAMTTDNLACVNIVETFLISKLSGYRQDLLVSETIFAIYKANGNVRIKELLSEFSLSQDALEKRFRKITGTTPKQFSHVVKMNFMIRQQRIKSSFTDLAFENGFYDQPHFNKDFKLFTGLTPTDFFRSGPFW